MEGNQTYFETLELISGKINTSNAVELKDFAAFLKKQAEETEMLEDVKNKIKKSEALEYQNELDFLRQQHNYSINDLAVGIGVTKSAMQQFCNLSTKLPYERYKQLVYFFKHEPSV